MKKAIIFSVLTSAIALFQLSCASNTKVAEHKLADEQMVPRAPTSTSGPRYTLNPKFEEPLPDEDKIYDQIRDGILAIQSQSKKLNGGALHRGTHAKGICASAEVEIFDVTKWGPSVASRIKKGIFSTSGRYPAQVRFANAAGNVQSDAINDVRAVSFSMKVPQALSNSQGLMDFSLNDQPTFPIGNAQVFADLMLLAQLQAQYGNNHVEMLKKLYSQLGRSRADAVLAAFTDGLYQEFRSGHTTPYQKMRFWSDVPFALGDDEAVKYSLKPCLTNQALPLVMAGKVPTADALSTELKRSLESDQPSACFDFQIQLLEPTRMTNHLLASGPPSYWVEHANVEWDEKEAPFYTVGRMTLNSGPTIDATTCEKWHIDVTDNTNATHHGIGSINRARAEAEAASARQRLGQ